MPVAEQVAGDHAPLGMRAGGFLVIPRVTIDEDYRGNIYATTHNTKSDMVTRIRPEVAVKSNWGRHALNVLVRADANRFATHTQENTTNYHVAMDGRLDVLRETSVGGGVAWTRAHEDRGDPNTPASVVEPQQFDTLVGKVGAYRGLGRLNARVESEARRLDYKNNYTIAGLLVDSSLRNRSEYTQSVRLGYKLDPAFEVFAKGAVDSRVYDSKLPLNRSSHGAMYVAGAGFDISGKSRGEFYGGYMRRDYRAAGVPGIGAPTYGAKLVWNPTGLTSVIAKIDRTIEETTLGASSGYVATRYKAVVQHALTRRVVLHADAELATNHYKGVAISQRRDTQWTAGAGVDYYLNRILKVGLGYTNTNRNSNVSGGDYAANAIMVCLSAAY